MPIIVGGPPPFLTLDDVKQYLGAAATDLSDWELLKALDAETALQRTCCRVPAMDDSTPAGINARAVLREAACRRVAVNLARRGLPLGMQMTDVGTAHVSTNDPEVRRLEGPFRKVLIG